MGLSPGVDTPGGHDVFILSPVYGHRYSHMKYKMYEKLFHLPCPCNCIPLFISFIGSCSLSFREDDLDRGGFGVFGSDSPGYYVEQEVLGGQYFPLLEEDSGRNTGLRRRDRTPTHSKKMQLVITNMQR